MAREGEQEHEHSIQGDTLVRTSVSQITSFDHDQDGGCHRKWFYNKKLLLPQKEFASQALGKEIHSQIEHFLKSGEDCLSPPARLAKQFMLRHPALEVEKKFENQDLMAAGIPLLGYIDVYNPTGQYIDPEGITRDDPPDSVEILDWKTTKNIKRYAKSGAGLVTTVQMPGYAIYAYRRNKALKFFRLSHVYIPTEGPKLAEKRTTLVPLSVIQARWNSVDTVTANMVEVAKLKTVEEVPYNLDSCDKFGGCSYKNICPRPRSNTNLTLFGRPRPSSSTPAQGTSRMSLVSRSRSAVTPAAPDAPTAPPVVPTTPTTPPPPPPPPPAPAAPPAPPAQTPPSGGGMPRRSLAAAPPAPASPPPVQPQVVAAPVAAVAPPPMVIAPPPPPPPPAQPTPVLPRWIKASEARQEKYYGIDSQWTRCIARIPGDLMSFLTLPGAVLQIPVDQQIFEDAMPAGLAESFAQTDARLAAASAAAKIPPHSAPPQPVVERLPDAPAAPAAMRPANSITPPDQPASNPAIESKPIPVDQVAGLSDAVLAVLRPGEIQQPAAPATAAPKRAGRNKKVTEAAAAVPPVAAPVAPASVDVVPVAPTTLVAGPGVDAALQAVLNPPPPTAVIAPPPPPPPPAAIVAAPAVAAPVASVQRQLSLVQPLTAAPSSNATSAAQETGFTLLINCISNDPTAKDLTPWRAKLCADIATRYNLVDLRVDNSTECSFGKWKGVLSALALSELSFLQGGVWVLHTRGDELNSELASALSGVPGARIIRGV